MDIKQLESVIPLAAFWVAFKALLDAAAFANGIRDSVVSGLQHGVALTPQHRRAMFTDWCLTMLGSIMSAFVFSGLIFWMAYYFAKDPSAPPTEHVKQGSIFWAVSASAASTTIGAIFFLLCGISDLRLQLRIFRELKGTMSLPPRMLQIHPPSEAREYPASFGGE